MKEEEFNETYKKFEKVHRGIYLLQLNFLNKIEKSNLEIIVEFNKPQDEIDSMNLIKDYQEIPIIYKSNPNREIKTIDLQNYELEQYHKKIEEHRQAVIKKIIDDTKSW